MSDAENNGYLHLHRRMRNHAFWREPRKFSKAEAWLDLLMCAQWADEPRTHIVGMSTITTNRGQLFHSIRTLSDRWGWAKSSTQRFLNLLVGLKMITINCGTHVTIISICNFDYYNSTRVDRGTLLGQGRDGDGTGEGHKEEGKEGKEGKEYISPLTPHGGRVLTPAKKPRLQDTRFAEWWALYPRKISKQAAESAYLKALSRIIAGGRDEQVLFDGLSTSPRLKKDDPTMIPHATTWLNQGSYDDQPDTAAATGRQPAEPMMRASRRTVEPRPVTPAGAYDFRLQLDDEEDSQ